VISLRYFSVENAELVTYLPCLILWIMFLDSMVQSLMTLEGCIFSIQGPLHGNTDYSLIQLVVSRFVLSKSRIESIMFTSYFPLSSLYTASYQADQD
jgi:hypothetical protein